VGWKLPGKSKGVEEGAGRIDIWGKINGGIKLVEKTNNNRCTLLENTELDSSM